MCRFFLQKCSWWDTCQIECSHHIQIIIRFQTRYFTIFLFVCLRVFWMLLVFYSSIKILPFFSTFEKSISGALINIALCCIDILRTVFFYSRNTFYLSIYLCHLQILINILEFSVIFKYNITY